MEFSIQGSGKVQAKFGQSLGNVQAKFRQRSSNVRAMFGQCSGKVRAKFGQNLRTIYEDEPACVILTLLNI